jgi:tRNA G10  N-methylase Trm11
LHQDKDGIRLNITTELPSFIYTYACREDELSLCQLEMRAFFGMEAPSHILKSTVDIDPSRSPFIKERVEVMYQGSSLVEILQKVEAIELMDATFKVIFVKLNDLNAEDNISYEEQRNIERKLGLHITGEADVHHPAFVFGIVALGGQWYFGNYLKNKAVWLHHMKKPRNYSIALTTRLARAAVNIAVPHPYGIKAIDPCCGIGTVLVEALSMGIDMVGRDINHFIVRGARENLAHFELEGEVVVGAIANISTNYDVAIVDMPYNLFSTITTEEQFSILQHARRIASKVVVISIEAIDEMIASAGFIIVDRGVAKKGLFSRQVLVCI